MTHSSRSAPFNGFPWCCMVVSFFGIGRSCLLSNGTGHKYPSICFVAKLFDCSATAFDSPAGSESKPSPELVMSSYVMSVLDQMHSSNERIHKAKDWQANSYNMIHKLIKIRFTNSCQLSATKVPNLKCCNSTAPRLRVRFFPSRTLLQYSSRAAL